ncbi:helix-turn-helix domain-containing protein [Flavobacterium amniphilum]|uniref:helix-turn-helix domain-containing protein n=1 Tax=Flavobacterium amniphilum TaxID=1834035 RepID=UPI00202A2D9E|nr:helix-turn-helix domain-containing protein [Flavobacterium amniphilum]MCL9805716.1 helix-turn-helix domain-containing protein [Flavobacterium amniphilum]
MLIILLQNKFHTYYKGLMLLCLISCAIVIGSWTFFQGTIPLLEHAYLWVISFPIDFLPGGLLYLYVKSVLKKQKKIIKWDYIHFIPALLHFIELVPFYLLPVKAKQLALTLYLAHPEKSSPTFILPMDSHIFLKTVFWSLYVILTISVVVKFRKTNSLWITRNDHIWFWITRLTAIHLIALIISIIGLIFFDEYAYREFSVLPPLFFILTCIILLMFKPKILYGLNFLYNGNKNSIKLNEEEETLSKTFELSYSKSKEYKEKIELLIHDKKVFLIKNYLLTDMSNDLDIPLHHLSYVINNEFGTNYTSFINKCRIDYIIEHRYDPEWAQFSLEGIGNEAGFNSRNTFFKAFKIATGKTPSEYFKKKEN